LYYTASGIVTPIGGRPVYRLRFSPLSTRTLVLEKQEQEPCVRFDVLSFVFF